MGLTPAQSPFEGRTEVLGCRDFQNIQPDSLWQLIALLTVRAPNTREAPNQTYLRVFQPSHRLNEQCEGKNGSLLEFGGKSL